MKQFLLSLSVVLCLSAATAGRQALAYSPQFDQAIESFNARQYAQALYQFQTEVHTNPQDPLTHYYMGLCYHHLNRFAEATQEYNWVLLNSQDPELIQRVQMGLQVLARFQSMPAWGSATSESPLPASVPQNSSQPSAPQAQEGGSASAFAGAKPKILDFYTTWCGPCKRFAPIFHKAEAEYKGRIEFLSLNAEEPRNAAIVRRYNLHGYPTIIFLNAAGRVVDRLEGAPGNLKDLQTVIQRAYGPAF